MNTDYQFNSFKVYLPCLDGIRFLTSGWLFAGLVINSMLAGCLKNFGEIFYYINTPLFALILSIYYTNDVFFFLSGFLLIVKIYVEVFSNLLVKDYCLTNKVNCYEVILNNFKLILKIVIKKYLKMLPIVILVVGIFTWILPFITTGPLTSEINNLNNSCG